MQSPTISAGRAMKVDAGWVSGMNTIRHPWLLRDDQYRRSVNTVNRGGIIQTRPGFGQRLILPAGNLQGMEHFRATLNDANVDYLVAAVDGNIYAVPFNPDGSISQPRKWDDFRLRNISFDPLAKFVVFCNAEKTVTILADQTIQIVPTYNVLMMQDGKRAAAFWDGVENRHCDESTPALETPRGLWMAYSGGRLWVARGKLIIASDLLNPLKFVERTEGEGRGDFAFRKEVTGVVSYVGDNRKEVLIVFTDDRSEVLQSGIKDRAKWPDTNDFQSILFPSTGCVAGRSIVFQAGLMWWYAPGGLVSSDAAASSNLTSQVNFKDAEMAFSKQFLANDQSMICGLSFENYLLMSCPIGQELNSETFVLDYSTISESSGDKIPAWSSVWTGIRPTQWISASIGSRKRAFCCSVDYASLSDGSHNHVWEAFLPEREDVFFDLDPDFTQIEYRQSIFCEWESRLLGDGRDLKNFQYADLDFLEIAGDVTLQCDYRGRRGSYKNILCKKIIAPINFETSGVQLTQDQQNSLGILRKQSRRVTTSQAPQNAGCPTCENKHNENVDQSFSLLVRWCGQAALEAVRIFADPYPEKTTGACEVNETKVCIVDEAGQNHSYARQPGFIPVDELYSVVSTQSWSSVQKFTATETCDAGSVAQPISVTATASYRSLISQSDADAQALLAATQAATSQAAYYRSIYPCAWDAYGSATRTCYGILNDSVLTIATQENGASIVGGLFTQDKSIVQNRITQRAFDGTRVLDWTQGTGFNAAVNKALVMPSAVNPDNISFIAGNFTNYDGLTLNRIACLLSTGEISPGFDATVAAGFDATVLDMAFNQTDKIVCVGKFTSYQGIGNKAINRLEQTGELDVSFTPPAEGFSEIYKVVSRPDDKIIVAGKWTVPTVEARVTMAGADTQTLTVSGVSGGKNVYEFVSGLDTWNVTWTGAAWEYTKNAVLISSTADTDTYPFDATGWSAGYTSSNPDSAAYGLVMQLNDDGTEDTGFARYQFTLNISPEPVALALQDDGKVLFAQVDVAGAIVRLETDGTVDTAFATQIGTGFNAVVNAMVLDGDQNIYVGGNFTDFDGTGINRVAKLDPTGAFDTVFATNIDAAANAEVFALAISDNILLIGGDFTSFHGDANTVRFARATFDGYFQPSFQITTQYANVRSYISQADADTQAATQATNEAVAALPCL